MPPPPHRHVATFYAHPERPPTPPPHDDVPVSYGAGKPDGKPEGKPDELVRGYSLKILRSVADMDGAVHPSLSDNPKLDPTSSEFSAKEWMKALMELSDLEPESHPRHSAGVSFRDLCVNGCANSSGHQLNVLNVVYRAPLALAKRLAGRRQKTRILSDFNGLVRSGEMLLVLGRPGSGASTLLKTIGGDGKGIEIDPGSTINYQGIPVEAMRKYFRGETIYQAEEDIHFPHLSVGQTLQFAALMRTPRRRVSGLSSELYAQHLRDVVMAMYGISHTVNTRVGNDFVRGVSGGERKRVSIAEATLNQSVIQCWDNSTRGLDSATAIDFTRTLRLSADLAGASMLVAIYQAAEASYEVFDKVTVLYEGLQIYFGPANEAKKYFTEMGFHCPDRQTTADFLTSLTNPAERKPRPGFEFRVPTTPEEFVFAWEKSDLYTRMMREIYAFEQEHPMDGKEVDKFLEVRQTRQSSLLRTKSPYTLSVPHQIWLCMVRGYQRLMHDLIFFGFVVGQNASVGLVLGSVYYNLATNAEAMANRTTVLFFATLFNSLAGAFEIVPLYDARPIIAKQTRYALYHPFVESISSMICDLPSKFFSCIYLNTPLYFLSNLRREAGPFFVFLLFGFSSTVVLSMVLRLMGHLAPNVYQGLAPYSFIVIGMVVYTGFVLPSGLMREWLRWLNKVNPIAYAYESLVINELSGRNFPCTQFVPPYPNTPPNQRTCSTPGSAPGTDFVNGDTYIQAQLGYSPSHLWRNYGIMLGFIFGFMIIYLLAVEFIDPDGVSPKNLVYLNNRVKLLRGMRRSDIEAGMSDVEEHELINPREYRETMGGPKVGMGGLAASKKVLHWSNLRYEVNVKGDTRRILDNVHGWVKPGCLTALMGSTGAGKTTLLDVLADRISVGVVSGDVSVNGLPRSNSFQRQTGYVKQQDIHLSTSTVREALRFSAMLRQSGDVTREEKYAYVEEVIMALEMERYADAIVGVPGGQGLNLEQRKRLTIGVELAAKPDLLLFLDEPTSGLDSQSAWSIGALIRKLADNGQAILCTIHQPSALLFQQFDRLLLLAKGGKMVYFGELGKDSKTMIRYFERHRARRCRSHENPAEWMLEITGSGTGAASKTDWPRTWSRSPEHGHMLAELQRLSQRTTKRSSSVEQKQGDDGYAVSFWTQFTMALKRSFQQYWRTPSYIYSKLLLCTGTTLVVGLSFQDSNLSLQGIRSQMFATFVIYTVLAFVTYQTMPHFIAQRNVFEARESASRTYSWYVFMLVNIIVELPWTALSAFLMFITWYYPIGMQHNAVDAMAERGGMMYLLLWAFMIFTSTYTDLIIAAVETAELGALLAFTLFIISLAFCGITVKKDDLPDFWIWMYRVSPLTYLVGAMLSVGLAHREVTCSPLELLHFQPLPNTSCQAYLAPYMSMAGGRLTNPDATDRCDFCPVATTDAYLANVNISYSDRWRNYGLFWIYIVFNVVGALALYWLARVPKRRNRIKPRK